MPRLITSLLVLMLGAWPTRATRTSSRKRRVGLRPSGANDEQDPVESPDRARARTRDVHHWPGEIVYTTRDRRTEVHGRWHLSFDASQRAQRVGTAGTLALDPTHAEAWETQLEALLMLDVPGARVQVVRGNPHGWQLLELRAPTQPETVVQLDRSAVAQLLDTTVDQMRVELRVIV